MKYIVRKGDDLAKIAASSGYSADEIWNAPENEALRASRTPELLSPGDILELPDSPPEPAALDLASDNAYVADAPTTELLLVVPYPMEQASQMSQTFTLTNADGSYTSTLALASDCAPGDTDGTSVMIFRDLTEGETYSLRRDDGSKHYSIFAELPYLAVSEDLMPAGELALEWDMGDGKRLVLENGTFDELLEKVRALSADNAGTQTSDE